MELVLPHTGGKGNGIVGKIERNLFQSFYRTEISGVRKLSRGGIEKDDVIKINVRGEVLL